MFNLKSTKIKIYELQKSHKRKNKVTGKITGYTVDLIFASNERKVWKVCYLVLFLFICLSNYIIYDDLSLLSRTPLIWVFWDDDHQLH